jgi:hypothetical protein
MEQLIPIMQAGSLSVSFYLVAYFLINWQWPETLLSVLVCTLVLYFLTGERTCVRPASTLDPIAAIAPEHMLSQP